MKKSKLVDIPQEHMLDVPIDKITTIMVCSKCGKVKCKK